MVKISRRRQPDVPLTGTEPSVELAPSPVVAGYSLVGVYPCAVWKPRCSSCNNNNNNTNTSNGQPGPVRSRVASVARPHPYYQQQQQQQTFTQQATRTTATTAAAGVQQTPQLLVTACSCREGVGTAPAELIPQASTVGTTPMIFVPFTVPNFVTNGCSPSSKVNKKHHKKKHYL